MGVTDRTKHFDGLDSAPAPITVPNSVSRHLKVPERSFSQVVSEATLPVLDSELNLHEDLGVWEARDYRRWHHPSGWLRGMTHRDSRDDFGFVNAGSVVDDSPGGNLIDGTTLVNSILMERREAMVAGFHLTIEYTNTQTQGWNLIGLEEPTIYDAVNFKRTDFLFLEVWQSLVAHGIHATADIVVGDSTQLQAGDVVTIGGVPLTAVLVPRTPGADDFQITPGDDAATAQDIADAINDPLNSFTLLVTATVIYDTVTVHAVAPGVAGNGIVLSDAGVTVLGAISVTSPTSGGVDMPNKPDQSTVYRHGNVQSPLAVALADEIVDPTLNFESSQRVQIQYRIRATGSAEGVNFEINPDGFSASASITAQGTAAAPVPNYPFVPADNASTWGPNTDATAYGRVDSGLWIAGDGSTGAAQALGALDGFVYAIPIGFVFRHNDCSDAGAAVQGFDPVNNANGAPMHNHGGYVGVIGQPPVVVPAGTSDRPDDHFADVISDDRLLDLRRHVIPPGPDFSAELQYQLQSVLDGTLQTWAIDAEDKQTLGSGSGDVSTRFLVCNEVGRTNAKGGNLPASGGTGRGGPDPADAIRNFDHVCRRFADQSVIERHVVAFYPDDRAAGALPPGTSNPGKYVVPAAGKVNTAAWYEGDVLHLDLTLFDSSLLGGVWQGLDGGGGTGAPGIPAGTINIASMAPPGTAITDVLSMYHDDGDYTVAVDQAGVAAVIQGLGTMHVEISLDANDTSATGGLPPGATYRMVGSGGTENGSPRRIFVEYEITYPIGVGTTDTPDLQITPDATVYTGGAASVGNGPGPLIEDDTTQRPVDWEAIEAPGFRSGYREVGLEYIGNDTVAHAGPINHLPVGSINIETLVSRTPLDLYFPRRVYDPGVGPLSGATSVFDVPGAAPKVVDPLNTEFGSSTRHVVLQGAPLSGIGHTLCEIAYWAQDPVPNYGGAGGGYQISVYFRSNAPQTAGVKNGTLDTSGDGTMPETLHVEPLLVSENIWTGQVGMGSVDLAFPYEAPLEQIPINDGGAGYEEWYFVATATTTIDDFDAGTGLLTLHSFVQADNQEVWEFGGPGANQPQRDAEFRSYYPFADDTTYRPTIMSQPLYGATRHKVLVPVLVRATEDVPGAIGGGLLYRKDELLLVVLTRFAELDDENNVRFIDPAVDNRTCAAVYRTRNMLMVVGG